MKFLSSPIEYLLALDLRVPHNQRNEMEQQVLKLLRNKMIRESQSPFASPTILVGKRDSTRRLYMDFRNLNNATIKNKYPIHVIEDLLDELHGAKIFTKLDLKYQDITISE